MDLPSSIAEESSSKTEKEPVYVKETQKEILDFYEENAKDRETVSSQGTAEIPTPPPSKEQSQTEKRVWLSDVPFISQVGRYPTGCESVSAVMACQYTDLSIDVDTFIRSYLPRGSFTYENGKMIGWHPNTCFMGDPFTQYGFGCYAPCIEKAILKFLPAGYTLRNTTGTSLTSLCHEYIDGDEKIAEDISYSVRPLEEGNGCIFLDTSNTLYVYSDKGLQEIDDNVDGDVYAYSASYIPYIKNYDAKAESGTLYVYTGGEPIKVAVGVEELSLSYY